MPEIVIVALRKQERRSCVGYFPSMEEVPPDWTPAKNPEFDIGEVMATMPDRSKEEVLAMMNRHWLRP